MRIPIVGFANLISGAILYAPLFERMGVSKKFVEDALQKVEPHRETIAKVDLVVGLISLLNRMHIIYIWFLPGGYPQSLVILGVGLTLAPELSKKFPPIHDFIVRKVEPYGKYVGALGLLFGLHAIL
jgi:hypothetical protein